MTPIQFTPEDLNGFEINRCYRGKVKCQDKDETHRALVLVHEVFNTKVAEVCKHIFRVLNDKSNPEFAKLTRWAIENISPAGQCATHFANPFTLETSQANPTHHAYNKNEAMKELFYLCKERGDRWYRRSEMFGELIRGRSGGSGMVAEVNQAAIEKVSAYLSLMKNWREGNATPLTLLEEEQFVKKSLKFLKDYRELLAEHWQKQIEDEITTKDTELYEILLNAKKKEQENLLKDIYRNRLEYGWLLDELAELYRSYSNEAIGKSSWLQQKQHFEQVNIHFRKQYESLLAEYKQIFLNQKETKPPNALPIRWFHDPNFLKLLDEKGAAIWPGDFSSPMLDLAMQTEWDQLREDTELPEQPWDSRKGRKWFVSALKSKNQNLFGPMGWFKVFERYNKLQHFAKPPQFRYPDSIKHPEWINFSEGGCFQYRDPKVIGPARLEITVNLLNPDQPDSWKAYQLEIALDHRLKTLGDRQLIQIPDGRWGSTLDNKRVFKWKTDDEGNSVYKEDHFYPWADADGMVQWIQLHGGNLIYRHGKFYLHFRYTYKTPKKPKLRDEKSGIYNYQPGTRLLGIDQGQKDDAVVAILELTTDGQLEPVAFQPFIFKKHKSLKPRLDGKAPGKVYYQWLKLPGGTSFTAISHAEKVRSERRKSVKRKETRYFIKKNGGQLPLQGNTRGRFLTRGQIFDKKLGKYIENCRELHYKVLAGAIFKLAKENRCQGIVMENLNSYKVSMKQDRAQNQRLMTWTMQKKTQFLESLCDAGQINFIQKSAAYTSQTCNQCESFGMRFNFPTKSQWAYYRRVGIISATADEQPYPTIVGGGDWFLCSNVDCCGKKVPHNPESRYMIQADANAARNLLIRAFRKEGWGAQIADKDTRKQIQQTLQTWLKKRFTRPVAPV